MGYEGTFGVTIRKTGEEYFLHGNDEIIVTIRPSIIQESFKEPPVCYQSPVGVTENVQMDILNLIQEEIDCDHSIVDESFVLKAFTTFSNDYDEHEFVTDYVVSSKAVFYISCQFAFEVIFQDQEYQADQYGNFGAGMLNIF